MNAQFPVEYGIPIPSGPGITRSQGANRKALEETFRSMRVGGSFPISSPHLTGEARCVAANLGIDILIKAEGKIWRCWLVGGEITKDAPPPKSLPPEPANLAPVETAAVVTGGRRPEREITSYLEKKGFQPEYAQDKIRFRHPKRLSRILTLHALKDGEVRLSFAHALPEFVEMWNISPTGELPLNFDLVAVYEALDDFFEVVVEEPPPGSLPFDERMKELDELIKRISNRHSRAANYEVNYDDLVAIANAKAYEVYIRFGDKPTYEFQCLVASSIERKFDSLLSKHYLSKCRAGAEVVSLTDELFEVLPSDKAEEEIATKEEFNEYLEKLTPTERLLMKSVIYPTDSLRAEEALNRLRYERIKSQSPKARLDNPKKYRLRKLALSTDKSENELKIALTNLIEKHPGSSSIWAEMVENLNG
jgi:hypothetical protein